MYFKKEENKNNAAFTLAEVLIALAIIGIVAALTMPALINKVQDYIIDTRAKKAQNRIVNGYKLMMAHDMLFSISSLPFLNCNDIACVSEKHKKIFSVMEDSNSGLKSSKLPGEYNIPGKNENSPFTWDSVNYIFATSDGMIFGVLTNEDHSDFSVVVDVNGNKKPNTTNKDLKKYKLSADAGKIIDISSELEESNCSADNLAGCTTKEACEAVVLYGHYDCAGDWFESHAEWFDEYGCLAPPPPPAEEC